MATPTRPAARFPAATVLRRILACGFFIATLTGLAVIVVGNAAIARATGPSWKVVVSPDALGAGTMLRAAAAVPGAKQVWAVGGTEKGQTVTALLSGGHWALVPSPSQGRGDRLDAVSAYSTSFAAAVGYHVNKFGLWQPLALIWNGSSWQTTKLASKPHRNLALEVVAATSPTSAWTLANGRLYQWDGTAWRSAALPHIEGATGERLTVLARVPGTSRLVALGHATVNGSGYRFVATDDDGVWTVTDAPAAVKPVGRMAATSAGFWGVGAVRYTDPGGPSGLLPYVANWAGGASWTGQTLGLYPGTIASYLTNATTVPGSADVWAVGSADFQDADGEGLFEHWDGTSWTAGLPPDVDPHDGAYTVVAGIAALGPQNLWAVGWTESGTLILHYS